MTDDVKTLREATGAGVMDCKRALDDAKGDFEKAKALINERGLVKAETKKDRVAGAGLLMSYIHNERVGTLLQIHAETDFVVRGDLFKTLARDVAMHIAAMNPETVEELLAQPFVKDESMTIENLIKSVTAKVGENIKVERFIRYSL
ncbi:MAG: elongation factor T [Parcubacteria group bacterium LiPW_41]|nr:MAG: elongation factor T [Parcubacteria group bacterium LiPW_41]